MVLVWFLFCFVGGGGLGGRAGLTTNSKCMLMRSAECLGTFDSQNYTVIGTNAVCVCSCLPT